MMLFPLSSHTRPSTESPSRAWRLTSRNFIDGRPLYSPSYSRNCRTPTASPAEPGDLPWLLARSSPLAPLCAQRIPAVAGSFHDPKQAIENLCGRCLQQVILVRSLDIPLGRQHEGTGNSFLYREYALLRSRSLCHHEWRNAIAAPWL
jgi:hypothetical protein